MHDFKSTEDIYQHNVHELEAALHAAYDRIEKLHKVTVIAQNLVKIEDDIRTTHYESADIIYDKRRHALTALGIELQKAIPDSHG